MKTLSHSEIDQINALSYKIDNGSANALDYINYETLLLKAGLTREQIRGKLTQNGFQTYEQYIDARNSAKTREERKVTNVIIVAGLVVLSAIIALLISSGRLTINDEE